ncbi:ATP-binding protein [Micromonospora sp. BQ11]|uniref:ATP-binding protein n=1 Tax=Micromonospora sp. BQ11 TaxID=3452212 RepID=UPI003F886140
MTLLTESFTVDDIPRLRRAVAAAAAEVGLPGDDRDDFVVAVHELMTNGVRHGGGGGELRLTHDHVTLTCCVSDRGPGVTGAVPERPEPSAVGRRGLWLADALTDGLVLDCGPDGMDAAVSVSIRRRPAGE